MIIRLILNKCLLAQVPIKQMSEIKNEMTIFSFEQTNVPSFVCNIHSGNLFRKCINATHFVFGCHHSSFVPTRNIQPIKGFWILTIPNFHYCYPLPRVFSLYSVLRALKHSSMAPSQTGPYVFNPALQEKHDFAMKGRYGTYFHCHSATDHAMECCSIAKLLPHYLRSSFPVAMMRLAMETVTVSKFNGIMLRIFL